MRTALPPAASARKRKLEAAFGPSIDLDSEQVPVCALLHSAALEGSVLCCELPCWCLIAYSVPSRASLSLPRSDCEIVTLAVCCAAVSLIAMRFCQERLSIHRVALGLPVTQARKLLKTQSSNADVAEDKDWCVPLELQFLGLA